MEAMGMMRDLDQIRERDDAREGARTVAIALGGLAGLGWALPFLALWYGAEIALCRIAGWPCGPRDIAAMGLRDLLLAPLWVTTWMRRGFEWRGTAMGGLEAARAGGAEA